MIINVPSQEVCTVGRIFKPILRSARENPQYAGTGLHKLGLIQRRSDVVRYLNNKKPNTNSDIVDKFVGGYKCDQLYDKTMKELIDDCGDDLNMIMVCYGLYGLAQYAYVAPQKIIRRTGKIKEIPFVQTSTFREICYQYLLGNRTGVLDDIYTRFGKMGLNLYKSLRTMNLIEEGKYGYIVSDLGQNHMATSEAINTAAFKHQFNQYFANQRTFHYNKDRRRWDNEFREGTID